MFWSYHMVTAESLEWSQDLDIQNHLQNDFDLKSFVVKVILIWNPSVDDFTQHCAITPLLNDHIKCRSDGRHEYGPVEVTNTAWWASWLMEAVWQTSWRWWMQRPHFYGTPSDSECDSGPKNGLQRLQLRLSTPYHWWRRFINVDSWTSWGSLVDVSSLWWERFNSLFITLSQKC